MKNIHFFLILSAIAAGSMAQTIYLSGQSETGTGSRALALANNHTALSSGVADLYWNPGALSFSVSREIQMSLYGFRLSSASEFFNVPAEDDDLQRFRIGSAGFSIALPTTRGGMSLAGSYSNPQILDDIFRFSGKSTYNDTLSDIFRSYRVTGNLNYWSMGFGMQVASGLGAGITASLITGKGVAESLLDKEMTSGGNNAGRILDDYTSEGRYVGYDLRAGLFYKTKLVSAGIRFVVPQIIRYYDYISGTYDNYPIDETDKFTMFAPYRGAAGISLTLPVLTISADLRSTLPYDFLFPVEKIPGNSQASAFKTGGGIGVEVPLVVLPLILRAGYSLDEFDLHPYAYDFISQPSNVKEFDWSDGGIVVTRNLHRISAGIGYTTESMSFDLSYGFSTWALTTSRNLEQTYLMHRVLASVAVRF